MRAILFLLITFSFTSTFGQQSVMNIYQSNSTVFQLPISTIDSVNFTTNPPPSVMNIYQINGNVISLVIASIDSITYSLSGGGGNLPGYLNPVLTYGTVTDIVGNSYYTVQIGTQEWMAENLRTTHYANGDPILHVEGMSLWLTQTVGVWSYFDDDGQYDDPYGKLYNGYSILDTRNVCPVGWHVPSDVEWTTLTDYLGGLLVAGTKMKSTASQYWDSPNIASNESGFSGLPGSVYDVYNYLEDIGSFGQWWCSTQYPPNPALATRMLYHSSEEIEVGGAPWEEGVSVRCLRD